MGTVEGLNRLDSRINDLFDENFDRARALPSAPAAVWLTSVDILASKDGYLICGDRPGMKKEDFNLEVNDGTLTLSGERKAESLTDGVDCHRNERIHDRFSRSFNLPQTVKQEGIEASYRDGILEIHVPKVEEAKSRQVAISEK